MTPVSTSKLHTELLNSKDVKQLQVHMTQPSCHRDMTQPSCHRDDSSLLVVGVLGGGLFFGGRVVFLLVVGCWLFWLVYNSCFADA